MKGNRRLCEQDDWHGDEDVPGHNNQAANWEDVNGGYSFTFIWVISSSPTHSLLPPFPSCTSGEDRHRQSVKGPAHQMKWSKSRTSVPALGLLLHLEWTERGVKPRRVVITACVQQRPPEEQRSVSLSLSLSRWSLQWNGDQPSHCSDTAAVLSHTFKPTSCLISSCLSSNHFNLNVLRTFYCLQTCIVLVELLSNNSCILFFKPSPKQQPFGKGFTLSLLMCIIRVLITYTSSIQEDQMTDCMIYVTYICTGAHKLVRGQRGWVSRWFACNESKYSLS